MIYVKQLLKKLDLEDSLSHTLVQGAYCNSQGTKFLKEQGIPNPWVKTGVKNAHPIVIQYDIAANDEPNGHGCLFYNKERLEEVLKGNQSIEAQKLRAILEISNIVIGDSISNMLVMEAMLYDLDMSIEQFCNFYKENPSRMYIINVKDRMKFKILNGEEESRLESPIDV